MNEIFSYDEFHVSEVFNYCGIEGINSQGSPIIVYNKKGIYYLYAVVMHVGKDSE